MKPFWKSKTIWANLAGLITYVAGAGLLPPGAVPIATGLVIPILNILLRFKTDEAVYVRKKAEQ